MAGRHIVARRREASNEHHQRNLYSAPTVPSAEGADWKRQRMAAEPGFKLEALELTVEVSKDLLLVRSKSCCESHCACLSLLM